MKWTATSIECSCVQSFVNRDFISFYVGFSKLYPPTEEHWKDITPDRENFEIEGHKTWQNHQKASMLSNSVPSFFLQQLGNCHFVIFVAIGHYTHTHSSRRSSNDSIRPPGHRRPFRRLFEERWRHPISIPNTGCWNSMWDRLNRWHPSCTSRVRGPCFSWRFPASSNNHRWWMESFWMPQMHRFPRRFRIPVHRILSRERPKWRACLFRACWQVSRKGRTLFESNLIERQHWSHKQPFLRNRTPRRSIHRMQFPKGNKRSCW